MVNMSQEVMFSDIAEQWQGNLDSDFYSKVNSVDWRFSAGTISMMNEWRMVSLEQYAIDFLVGVKTSKKSAYKRNQILTKSVNNFEILPHTFPYNFCKQASEPVGTKPIMTIQRAEQNVGEI